jgi:hypothetical protein
VPLIGRVSTRRPVTRRNSSGELGTSVTPAVSSTAPNGAGASRA